jgi:hypothetical protein
VCINPTRDFGFDSAALRIYLLDAVPDVCFTNRWVPALEPVRDRPPGDPTEGLPEWLEELHWPEPT